MEGPKTEKIGQMFDSIAPDYDRLNHIMSLDVDRTWRRKALKHIVKKDTAQEILDIACGTGDFSIVIAEHAHPQTHVHGLDLSDGMLKVMRGKVSRKGLEARISCEQGSAEQMRYSDASYDCVTIAFGIRNFEHREAALREILRVLKPGGKLVILELSVPSNPIIRWCYNLYFTRILPLVGGSVSGDKAAYKYLPASVLSFPKKEEWMGIMRSCGYTDVLHKAYTLGICRLYTGTKP